VLRALQPTQLKRAHYVAPPVWAWRENRVKHFPGLWDELLCLLPFEPPFLPARPAARFVGHPGAGKRRGRGNAETVSQPPCGAARRQDPHRHAGSRQAEVARLLPVLEATIGLLPDAAGR